MKKILLLTIVFIIKTNVFSQNEMFRGTVYDVLKYPLVGASIENIDTGNSTMSDTEGKFVIKGNIGNTIRICSLGYESKEIPLRSNIKKNNIIILKDLRTTKKRFYYSYAKFIL